MAITAEMVTYARLDAGMVAELIEIPADGPAVEEMFHPDLVAALVEVPAGISPAEGWTWDGNAFAPSPPAAPPPVQAVTMRQARLALLATGKLDDVEAAIAAAPRAVRIEWEYATQIERASPIVAAIAAELDLDEAALDALFAAAAQL